MVRYHPTSFPFIFFSTFNLGVAMVAMVAMPREYTENGSRQTKLPKRGGTRTRNESSHACVTFGSWPPWPPATMATFGADLYIWLVRYHPTSFPFIFFSTFNLGVAMVAMVAMPREYTENGSRQTKLPDAW